MNRVSVASGTGTLLHPESRPCSVIRDPTLGAYHTTGCSNVVYAARKRKRNRKKRRRKKTRRRHSELFPQTHTTRIANNAVKQTHPPPISSHRHRITFRSLRCSISSTFDHVTRICTANYCFLTMGPVKLPFADSDLAPVVKRYAPSSLTISHIACCVCRLSGIFVRFLGEFSGCFFLNFCCEFRECGFFIWGEVLGGFG